MRHFNSLIFDENLSPGGAVLNTTTSQDWSSRLAQWDQVAYWIWIDNAGGTGSVTFTLQHSGDGRNFVAKTSANVVSVNVASFSNPSIIQDPQFTTQALFGYAQILISAPTTVTNCHVKIYAVARDQGGR